MISVNHISKSFRLYNKPSDRLKEILLRRRRHRVHQALRDVSFTVESGETLGIIGRNGAGKSTLLKILTGVLMPDAGHVQVEGRVTGLLELGTGFNPEYSGLANIQLNGSLLGMTQAEIEARRDAIVEFSELGEFIESPIKTYSSGMVMRLAFSIAIHADPQVFVVDEALSVGDAAFQQKCMDRIKAFKRQGGSIIFVSHDMNSVKILCDKALLLAEGNVVEYGEPEQVINAYNFYLAKNISGENVRQANCGAATDFGDRQAVIAGIELLDEHGREAEVLLSGRPVTIRFRLRAEQDLDDVTLGILFRDKYGQDIFGVNSEGLKQPISLQAGQDRVVSYAFEELNIGPGKYTLTAALHSGQTHVEACYHWIDWAKTFEVAWHGPYHFIGLNRLKPLLRIE